LREADTQIKEMRRSMGIQAIPEPAEGRTLTADG
jgi:hypothetical protein